MSRERGTNPCIVHETWTKQADWMRRMGATDAAWSASGELIALTLGPKPHEPTTTQPKSIEDDRPTPAPAARRMAAPGLTPAVARDER